MDVSGVENKFCWSVFLEYIETVGPIRKSRAVTPLKSVLLHIRDFLGS